ncbi:phenylacetate--CoA ligase family protein [Clostridium sp. WLY-B-L2]|uniref:Phenylacetate--CoA ligase family protein n=1 Tax=Clostridium aromativorans TaxID=2836848 RepID=A0ABS8N965_9CLOT|nr:phenylacetate--CoA ligase family protein [Clostridium aromativorans]MCC9296348.1 phenylacetate--CoA ligase family protein [Clostridium aromativorans]
MFQVKKLIEHAYRTVPYYTNIFNEYAIKPNQIQSFTDLKRIPYLTKKIVQDNLKDLVSTSYNRDQISYVTTGGSTGIPMGFYRDKNSASAIEYAFICKQWERTGFNAHKINKNAILRGNIPSKGIYEKVGNNLILSSYQLTDGNMIIYIKLLEKFNPDFIQAYPSSISLLSDFILDNNLKVKLNNLKAVLCGSENMYDFQRRKIERAFNVRVYSWYGHTEGCCLAGECEKSNNYHIFSEYGYTELINKNGEDVTEENGIGEIVATGFNNYVVPFIRYKTMDLAVNTNQICSCGRNYKLIKRVQGREQEQIITKDKAKIAMTSIIFSQHFNAFGKIRMMQLVQNEVGKVLVKIVEKEKLNKTDLNEISDKMKNAAYNRIDVEIKIVDNIVRTKSGKYKFLIQNLNIS